MQSLVQIDVRCGKHERPVASGCVGCDLERTLQKEYETIRARRAAYLDRVTNALQSKQLVIARIR
jgi:hypothetical protein